MRKTLAAASLVVVLGGCTMPIQNDSDVAEETSEALSGGSVYFFKLPLLTNKCLDVQGGSTSDGAKIEEWTCNGGGAQKFQAVSLGSGYWQFKNTNSGKCLDVKGAATSDGTVVQQYSCKSSSWDNQAWTEESVNGYKRYRGKQSGKCLDVTGANSADGTQIETWSCSTSGAQTWNPVSTSGGGTSGIAGVISQSQFDSWFPNKASLYTYSGLTSMNNKYSDIANQSDTTLRKREVAAILANFAHETGYYAAGNALGYDLLHNPGWVASNASISAQTAAWYWRTQKGPGGYGNNCHDAMNASGGSGGFGATIWHINGSLECGKPSGSIGNQQMLDRVNRYKTYCDRLGVSYGNNLTC